MSEKRLIVMQNNLGHGHVGDILITTQSRVDNNGEPIAKDIIDQQYALELVQAYNSHKALVDALEAWQLMDTESADKCPVPDYLLRVQYRKKARVLTEAALPLAKGQ